MAPTFVLDDRGKELSLAGEILVTLVTFALSATLSMLVAPNPWAKRVEGDAFDLEVIGTIPPELDGSYIRNSADHQYPPLSDDDLFLNGDGMLHQVRISSGHADLRTRLCAHG